MSDIFSLADRLQIHYDTAHEGATKELSHIGFIKGHEGVLRALFGDDIRLIVGDAGAAVQTLASRGLLIEDETKSRLFGVRARQKAERNTTEQTVRMYYEMDAYGAVVFTEPGTTFKVAHFRGGVICARADVPHFEELIKGSVRYESVITPPSELTGVQWDERTIAVSDDVKFFEKKIKWFSSRDLPYKRGYLFWGPPGNGKTSVIRSLSSYFGVEVETFDFSADHKAPDTAFKAFMEGNSEEDKSDSKFDRSDITTAYRLLVLEDIDRLFPKVGEPRTRVTLQCLLNELDGAQRQRGTIVVATANHPENLDRAVLLRPGRFDRIVEFRNPDQKNATAYLKNLFRRETEVTSKVLETAVEKLGGTSYATHEKLLYVSAVSAAKRDAEEIADCDVENGIASILSEGVTGISGYENGGVS